MLAHAEVCRSGNSPSKLASEQHECKSGYAEFNV